MQVLTAILAAGLTAVWIRSLSKGAKIASLESSQAPSPDSGSEMAPATLPAGDPAPFFLNGRRQAIAGTVLGLVAATLGSVSLLDGSALVYHDGLPAAAWLAGVWMGAALLLLIVGGLAHEASSVGAITLAEAVTHRFEGARLLHGLLGLVGLCCPAALVFLAVRAAGNLGELWRAGSFEIFASAALVMAGASGAAANGRARIGRRKVLGGLVLVGAATAGAAALASAGAGPAWGALGSDEVARAMARDPASGILPASTRGLAGLALAVIVSAVLQPAVWQVCAAAESEEPLEHGTWLFVWASAGLIVPAILAIGFAGRALYPLAWSDAWELLPNAAVSDSPTGFDQLLPALVRGEFAGLPRAIGIFAAAAAWFAVGTACLAALETNLSALGTLVARDIFRGAIRPTASLPAQIRAARAAIVAAALLAGGLAVFNRRVPEHSLGGLALEVCLLVGPLLLQFAPAVIDTLYFHRARSAALAAGILCGTALVVLESPLVDLAAERIAAVGRLTEGWERYAGALPQGAAALAVNLLVAAVGSALLPPPVVVEARPAR